MGMLDYFRPVESWSAEKVREFLASHGGEEYNLLDVRLEEEYAAGHLPGARLMPLAELTLRCREVAPELPTIVYCASGVRSKAAATILAHAGFSAVYNLEGGMQAWKGLVAAGTPEMVMTFFAAARTPEEHVALAWVLEDGTRQFYAEVAGMVQDVEAANLFRELARAEEQHKASLVAVYEGLAGRPAAADFPRGILAGEAGAGCMEGGFRVEEVLSWTRGKQVCDLLELSVAIEAVAYDHYLILRRQLPDENARRVFELLSDEERRHLVKLTTLMAHFV
jgi:rhodanese-related sulfurtransferase/rubrerythrin